ncbi:sigma-54 interaction domain-containing protein [Dyadobacter jiangsuensis]|uniref:Sigma-54 interacting transcriptional regulator n=1 Tax=Dyadobacter jiangsuensis TaxID=1591085 RepID=A0A2P8GBZ7_9BACT|nr:sigma-54 dependent transcriptional regulator [Dyadobacter jiangsuensis]PSL31499.1 sigma-54 interacting transcriptional regulator [Dyadobacter jiangsuensis]
MEHIEYHPEIIGATTAMVKLRELVSQVAPTPSTVLVLGETGTGKDLVAKAIHQNSLRKNEWMITVNCAALPPDLIESELFGHEKGSFTGATERRIGKWELAENGTLFLDEIGELPLAVQAKLLRALQEREIERIGGNEVIRTDVRIIAATSKDLAEEVRQGRFRSDLFFRLNVFPISIPPLRERKQDIRLLAAHFLKKHAVRNGRKVLRIAGKVIKILTAHSWHGNVRELENLIERSVLMTPGPVIDQVFLSLEDQILDSIMVGNRVKTIDEVVREHVLQVLKLCDGKVAGPGGAAQVLQMPPTTLHSIIKRLGIQKVYAE